MHSTLTNSPSTQPKQADGLPALNLKALQYLRKEEKDLCIEIAEALLTENMSALEKALQNADELTRMWLPDALLSCLNHPDVLIYFTYCVTEKDQYAWQLAFEPAGNAISLHVSPDSRVQTNVCSVLIRPGDLKQFVPNTQQPQAMLRRIKFRLLSHLSNGESNVSAQSLPPSSVRADNNGTNFAQLLSIVFLAGLLSLQFLGQPAVAKSGFLADTAAEYSTSARTSNQSTRTLAPACSATLSKRRFNSLPPTRLNSFVKQAGKDAEKIFGDEEPLLPRYFGFDESHRLERVMEKNPDLTTGHKCSLEEVPSAWDIPQVRKKNVTPPSPPADDWNFPQ